MKIFNDYLEAFIATNRKIMIEGATKSSRIGDTRYLYGDSFQVQDPDPESLFWDTDINRIQRGYADDFLSWIMSGSQDTTDFAMKYPNAKRFLTRPVPGDDSNLPPNFNAFYGPRIMDQMEPMIEEMTNNENSRRSTIMILDAGDQCLFKQGESSSLEYPCTISLSFKLDGDELGLQTVMRSQNVAVVMQLDLFLFGSILKYVADRIGAKASWHQHVMLDGHIYSRDFEYVEGFTSGLRYGD